MYAWKFSMPIRRVCIVLPLIAVTAAANTEGEQTGDSKDDTVVMGLLRKTTLGPILDKHRLRLSGWTDFSYTASTAKGNHLPAGFNYLADEFALQQHWLRAERTIDESSTTASFGFRIDAYIGTDYRFTVARGLLDGQLTDDKGKASKYGVDPVQFYGELYFPGVGYGLDIKLGRFFAIYGAETIDTVSNPLGSHSYAFIYNPFTHTGITGTLKFDHHWSTTVGVVSGSDIVIDRASEPTFIGNIKFTGNAGESLALAVILGSGRYDAKSNFNRPQVFDLLYTQQFNPEWSYTLEGLYGFQVNTPDIGMASWYHAVNYLTYQFDSKLSSTVRFEFFNDQDGQRTGAKGFYTAVTWGFNIKPAKWLMLRPEIRFDHNNASRPFHDDRNLVTAALDVTILW